MIKVLYNFQKDKLTIEQQEIIKNKIKSKFKKVLSDVEVIVRPQMLNSHYEIKIDTWVNNKKIHSEVSSYNLLQGVNKALNKIFKQLKKNHY